MTNPLAAACTADGDGRIAEAEAGAAPEARFDRMDANADGRSGLHEMTGAAPERMDGRVAKRFERRDANGDGAVGRGEFADRTLRRSARFDGDGAVTRDEIDSGLRRGGG